MSEKSRLLINTSKSKVMAFHETAEVRRARRSLQASFHSPPPTTQRNPKPKKRLAPFHLISSFPTSPEPTMHLLDEVPHFDYLGLRLDEKFTMKPAKEAVLEKASKALIPVLAVVRSLKYQKCHHNPTLASSPITPLQLWKSSVLPHYLLYLRYFHNPSHISDLQRDLNQSLNRTMQVYGTHEGLLAETGTPPLHHTQQVQLAQFRYRLLSETGNVIPHSLFQAWSTTYWILAPPASLERRMHTAVCTLDLPRVDPSCPMPPEVLAAFPHNKERSYKRFLQKRSSKLWHTNLLLHSSQPTRLGAYVRLHLQEPLRRTLYQPAPYLRSHAPGMLNLLRLRTQAWIHRIPSHRHYGHDRVRIPYDHRHCPSPDCPPQTLGDELHVLTSCTPTDPFWQTQNLLFQGLSRLCQMPQFLNLDNLARVRIMLGNPPPGLLQKHMPLWQAHAPAQCAAFAVALHEHLLCVPQPGLPLSSSSEESDGYVHDDPVFTPLLPPPGFAFDQNPPDPSTLEPMHPQGSTLLDRSILFKWEHDGWCMGVIRSQNKNPRTRVAGQVANFFVLYPMDNSTGTHALTLTTYNNLLDARAPTNNWVLLRRPP